MAESNRLSEKVVKTAKEDETILAARNQWTNLYFNNGNVYLEYGSILSNGDKERAIATRSYYEDISGTVKYVTSVHV